MKENLEIKEYLKEKGITQAFLSRKTRIAPAKMSLALKGERKLSLDEYATICWVLGVNTDKFLHPRMPVRRE